MLQDLGHDPLGFEISHRTRVQCPGLLESGLHCVVLVSALSPTPSCSAAFDRLTLGFIPSRHATEALLHETGVPRGAPDLTEKASDQEPGQFPGPVLDHIAIRK